MTITWTILGAVALDRLLGGVHCAGMCGGIVAAVSRNPTGAGKPWLILFYNLGRIASYTAAGAAAGTAGGLGLLLDGLLPVQIVLYSAANILLIGLGLYLAGIRGPVARLERLGARFWSVVKPLTRRFMPADTVPKAFALGTLWGWLPCGLVYSISFTALLTGNTLSGAAVMLAFGLGMLPNLMAAAALMRGPRSFVASKPLRMLSGAAVLGWRVRSRSCSHAEPADQGRIVLHRMTRSLRPVVRCHDALVRREQRYGERNENCPCIPRVRRFASFRPGGRA
jgi:sulfite exporter TauE/SafE